MAVPEYEEEDLCERREERESAECDSYWRGERSCGEKGKYCTYGIMRESRGHSCRERRENGI